MLTSITPLGERGRGNRWAVTITAYAAGSALGGAATGLLLGAVGTLLAVPTPVALALAGVVCLAAAGVELGRPHLPGTRRQVDERWLGEYRGAVYGLGFGVQLGLGWATAVTSAATYAWLAVTLLLGSVPLGLASGVVFGLVRALPTVLSPPTSLASVGRRAAWLHSRRRVVSRVTGSVLLSGGAAVLLGAAG